MNRSAKRLTRFLVSVAAVTLVGAVIVAALALRAAAGQPATSAEMITLPPETLAWCTSDQASDPPFMVKQAGELWIGLARYSEEQHSEAMADPRWSVACALAFELWGLSDDAWNWCYEDAVRQEFLAPAVALLGLGRQEAAGSESFAEAPGDDPAEYVQACRFADRYWRHGAVGSQPADAGDAFLALGEAEQAWCSSHRDAMDSARRDLKLVPASDDSSDGSLAGRLSEVRACRFAYLVDLASDLPERVPATAGPLPEKLTYEALIVNRQNTPIVLSDVANGEDYSQSVAGCGWMRVNGVTRELPWTLGVNTGSTDSDAVALYEVTALSELAQGSHVSLLVTIEADGTAKAIETTTLEVGALC